MYNYIKGRLDYAEGNTVVIDANGIGYELYASLQTVQKLGNIGDVCKVYCFLSVREDEMSLYGFSDKAEKEFFKQLINVSGIGCKMAISILSSGSLSDILSAIMDADVTKLSKIKGIGKKTAERIVVELRDKIAPGAESAIMPTIGTGISAGTANSEAVEALLSLGYTRQEAVSAVSKVERTGMSTEQVIIAALKG